jgi:hypothetical protein
MMLLSDPPKPPGSPSDEPDPDAPVPVEEPPKPIPVPPDLPPEPLRATPRPLAGEVVTRSVAGEGAASGTLRLSTMPAPTYARLMFQNSGPLYSSFPVRLLRYAVGI